MDEKIGRKLVKEQLEILDAAALVLQESYARVQTLFSKKESSLSVGEKESCEALTARFARLNDFLFQKMFRILDRIELQEEGTAIDRLNRMEKRGIISSSSLWRELRELRNQIAHEYLIEKSDRVLKDAVANVPELISTVGRLKQYIQKKGYG